MDKAMWLEKIRTKEMGGRTVLVTGGTGGIGQHTAIGLARLGARVVVTGRDRARGEAGVGEIRRQSGNPRVELLLGDLSSQAEVRRLAESFSREHERLDVLVNNAGLLEAQRRLTVDGLEAHLAVNVLAPFLLTRELLGPLRTAARSSQGAGAKRGTARVVLVTGGLPSAVNLDNLQAEKDSRGLGAYSHSKATMTAMAFALARRLETDRVTVNVCYPGGARTAMTGAMTAEMPPGPMRLLMQLMFREDGGKGAARASRSSVMLASGADLEGVTGRYFDTRGREARPHRSTLDPAVQERVWEACERLTGLAPAVVPGPSRAGAGRPT